MTAKIKGQRATASDVSSVSGAAGVGENPPVITKEAGQKVEKTTRHTGRNNMNKKGSGSGHDGVQGSRGGTRV